MNSRTSLSRRSFMRPLAAGLAVRPFFAAPSAKPNIVVIVSDDHGYADVSAYDHPKEIATPNIDRIARSGVRFTQGYASGYVCAPTRAGLMTGRYQQRFGFYTASDSRAGLPLPEITMADLLKRNGYTTGAFGKWHLGIEMPYHPVKRGFDEFYGFLGHGAHDYFDLEPTAEKFTSIWRNDSVIADSGYLTDNLGREAVSFVRRNRSKPFFLYLAFNAVHFPMQAPEATVRRYDTGNRGRDILLAMLEHEDRAVGQVLNELKAQGVDKNTLIVFLSDNGGARANSSNNGDLRDFKASVYEGGIRVPFLMSWPGRLPENTVSQEPVICMDVLPTAAAAAGIALPADREYHGRNLLPYLTGKPAGPAHEWLFWDGGEGRMAARHGRWKLVSNSGKTELFDLDADVSEKHDLSAKHPDIVQKLQAGLDNWRKGNAPRIRQPGGGGGGEDRNERKKARKKKKEE